MKTPNNFKEILISNINIKFIYDELLEKVIHAFIHEQTERHLLRGKNSILKKMNLNLNTNLKYLKKKKLTKSISSFTKKDILNISY